MRARRTFSALVFLRGSRYSSHAMVPALALAIALAVRASGTAAAPAPEPEPKAWTLEALTQAAEAADPRVLEAAAELSRQRALEAQAHAGHRPTLDWLVLGEPVPQLRNDPDHLDAVEPSSRLRNLELSGVGIHGHAGANLTWPIYTFGRAEAQERAASRAVAASGGAAQAARGRAARDAAEIFWGYQLARRSLTALDETDRQLAGARERVERLVDEGSARASKQDLAQLDAVRAELASRRTDAAAARDLALETARTVAGVPADAPFALATAALEAQPVQLAPLGRYVEVALAQRPEVLAARDTVLAREAAVAARRRALYPELVVTGYVDLNWTGSNTPQTNPFAWDPYNRLWGGLGLALRGTLDPWRPPALVQESEAEVERARAQVEAAERAVRLEVTRSHVALRAAHERAVRLREQEAAAKRWLAQAEAGFDAGHADAQAVLHAALASARAGAERVTAARDAQVAWADLTLALGTDPRSVR